MEAFRQLDWAGYSALMFAASVILYILVRKLQNDGVDSKIITFALGAMPAPLLGIYVLITGQNINISFEHVLIFVLNGVFLSYLGNKLSVLGIKAAPNPGYSLIIQKSYAPYTALLSVFFFDSELTTITAIAIAIIIVSAAQVMVEPTKVKNKRGNMTWVVLSLATFMCFGTLALVNKYLLSDGVTPIAATFWNFTFAGIAFSIENILYLQHSKINSKVGKQLLPLFVIGLCTVLFNVFMKHAFLTAPNAGYVNIINTASVVAITVFSAIFFRDKLNIQKTLGILGVVCGLALLFIG